VASGWYGDRLWLLLLLLEPFSKVLLLVLCKLSCLGCCSVNSNVAQVKACSKALKLQGQPCCADGRQGGFLLVLHPLCCFTPKPTLIWLAAAASDR
jgi:hypothetical protein